MPNYVPGKVSKYISGIMVGITRTKIIYIIYTYENLDLIDNFIFRNPSYEIRILQSCSIQLGTLCEALEGQVETK